MGSGEFTHGSMKIARGPPRDFPRGPESGWPTGGLASYVRRMRIVLADDHAIVLKGLRGLLASEPDLQVVAEEMNGEAALGSIRRLAPEVAVLDIEMPGMSGLDVAKKVAEERLSTAVVLLSVHRGSQFVAAAVEAGVGGYVLKEDAPADLLAAIRATMRGELYLSPRVTRPALAALREPDAGDPKLSPRERDIVRLLADGLSSKEIAVALTLTPKTVDTYRQNIMAKLGLHSVAAIVKYAIRHRIARIDD